jgi:hypothetical protein
MTLLAQIMAEPYIWHYLCFESMRHAQYALGALVSVEQLRKVSLWTRKIEFRGKDYHIGDKAHLVHVSDSTIIVLKHAARLVELMLPDLLVTNDILATASAAASESLCSLVLGNVPNGTMSYILDFRNLRHLVVGGAMLGSPQRDSDWTAPARVSASIFPELRELRLTLLYGANDSPFVRLLLECRFECLRRLSIFFAGGDIKALATFFQRQSALESCQLIADDGVLAAALVHISCSRLTLFEVPPDHADAVLNPAVRTLYLRSQFGRMGAISDESLFRLMNMLEARSHADARLTRVRVSAEIRSDVNSHVRLHFRWHTNPGSSKVQQVFMARMRLHGARLGARGITLLDHDGFTADGIQVEFSD